MNYHDAIREMVLEVQHFTQCHAIWREFHNPEKAEKYSAEKHEYKEFFWTIVISLQTDFCVRAYQIFDGNPKTKSLRRLVRELKSQNQVLAAKLELGIKSKQALLGKFSAIRNNVYAHRNRQRTPASFFSEQNLKIREMKEAVNLAQQTIIGLAVGMGLEKEQDMVDDFSKCKEIAIEATEKVFFGLSHSLAELYPKKYAKIDDDLIIR